MSAGVTVLMVLILYCLHFPRATTHTYFTYLFTPVANREVTGEVETVQNQDHQDRQDHGTGQRYVARLYLCAAPFGPQSAQYRQHQFR